MKIAYFDAFAGISSDMALGAFISAGIDLNQVEEELQKMNVGKIDISISNVVRSNISATKVNLVVNNNDLINSHERSYLDIASLIKRSHLSENVKRRSLAVFELLARAETRIHNSRVEEVHFHEVGAIDSILEIVGTSICLELSKVKAVYTSPIRVGSGGFIEAHHGTLPIPTPAALEILKGYPIILDDMPFEMTTPSGAAIVRAFSSGVMEPMLIEVEDIGYGAGTKEFWKVPSLLRIIIGNLKIQNSEMDSISKIGVEPGNY